MQKALFCVTCMVDNGCTHTRYDTYVMAPTVSSAKYKVKQYWDSQDSETVATIESARIVHSNEIICVEH